MGKKVTFKELALVAKDNEKLKNALVKFVTDKKDGSIPEGLISLAAEYGYDLADDDGGAFTRINIEELGDDMLDDIAGGSRGTTHEDKYFDDICLFFMKLLGLDPRDCFD